VWATAEGLLALKNLKKSFGKDINSLNSLVKQRIDLLKGRAAPIKQPTIQEWMQTPEGAAKLSQRLAENKAADLAELQKQQRSQSKQAKYQMEVERRKNQLADLEAKRAADQAKIELESMRQGPPTPPPFYQSVLPD
jgi:ATPase subunit of ABC transporter with duplicated ATPase domains